MTSTSRLLVENIWHLITGAERDHNTRSARGAHAYVVDPASGDGVSMVKATPGQPGHARDLEANFYPETASRCRTSAP